jgi:hypothetical protein
MTRKVESSRHRLGERDAVVQDVGVPVVASSVAPAKESASLLDPAANVVV